MDPIIIPTNYTDAGRLLGLFPVRHAVEALILCVPLALLMMGLLPLGLTGRLIGTVMVLVLAGGLALAGIQGDSLLTFLRIYFDWRRKRRILIYRGDVWIKQKGKETKPGLIRRLWGIGEISPEALTPKARKAWSRLSGSTRGLCLPTTAGTLRFWRCCLSATT